MVDNRKPLKQMDDLGGFPLFSEASKYIHYGLKLMMTDDSNIPLVQVEGFQGKLHSLLTNTGLPCKLTLNILSDMVEMARYGCHRILAFCLGRHT